MSKTTLSLLLPLSLILAACTQPPQESESKDTAAAPAAPASPAPAAQASLPVPSTETAASTPATTTTPADTPAARDAVLDALRKFATLTRYRATMSTSTGADDKPIVSTLDFVAPDRYRIESPGAGTQVIIGQTMYLEVDGRRTKVAAPANVLSQWRSATAIADAAASLTAHADGHQMVAAQPSAKFIVTQATPTPVQTTIWIGPKGYPIRVDTADGRTSIRYTRYDDPELKIEPPK